MKAHRSFWTILLTLASALMAQAATVTATLDPPDIALGEATQLTVTVTGSQEQVVIPTVPGLDVTSVGQSSQVQINNGSITLSAAWTYAVSAQREGNFTIPSIRVGGAASLPLTLHVGKGSGSQQNLPPPNVAQTPNSGPVVQPAPGVNPSPNQAGGQQKALYGWLQITIPKKEIYIGEFLPVDIKAYIRNDIRFNVKELPQFTGDGLSLNSLGTKPDQSAEDVGGHPYLVLTWHTALTGVKTGEYPIVLQMPLVVSVPVQMPQMNGDFDSFFQNAFSAMNQRKEVTLKNIDQSVKIVSLPAENRPVDFSGAVGQFDVDASASPTQVNAGDPITLKVKVTGKGNFDRVSLNGLPADANWKTYTPKSSFDASDSVGYEGTKTFEQPIIPNNGSIKSVPSVSFSYFDPEAKRYQTKAAAQIPVTVTGTSLAAAPVNNPNPVQNSTPAPSVNSQPTPGPTPAPGGDLVMNKLEPGTFFATLRPVYLSPTFLAGQALPLVALVGGMFFIRRQRKGVDQLRLRTNAAQQAIRKQVEAMDEAIQNHQTGSFFIHARGALQQKFGLLWDVRPEAITVADVQARLGDASQHVRPIFEMADQASYSELHLGDADLAQWRQVVMNELSEKAV